MVSMMIPLNTPFLRHSFRKAFSGVCYFSLFSCCRNKNREARMLMKMLSAKNERKLWNIKTQPNKSTAFKQMDGKRGHVLNKMFMLNVTQAMMSEEFDDLLHNRGLQVTKVSVDAGLQSVLVFWVAKDNEDPIEVQRMLEELSGSIRKKLMFSNVMGRVPEIRFRRDHAHIQYHITMSALHQLNMASSEDIVEFNIPEPALNKLVDHGVPIMRQDTLGLNHNIIMNRILRARTRSYPLTFPDLSAGSDDKQSAEEDGHINDEAVDEKDQRDLQYATQKAMQKFMAQQRKLMFVNKSNSRKNYNDHLGEVDNEYDSDNDACPEDPDEFDQDMEDSLGFQEVKTKRITDLKKPDLNTTKSV